MEDCIDGAVTQRLRAAHCATDIVKNQHCVCGARRKASVKPTLLLFSVTCILTVWCNARTVHVMRHLADKRYSNLWDEVISNAWLNILEGVWKNWKSWDPSRLGAAYIRHGVAADQREPEEIRVREHRRVYGWRNVCCLRACAVNCDCAIAILEHLEVVGLLYQDLLWDRAKLLGLPSLFRATALPWTTFRDHQNLQNLRTFGLPLTSETKDK